MYDSAVLQRYYRLHSRIYDATRWSFLFGRAVLIQRVSVLCTPEKILEVGCGTGSNLLSLCQAFPRAHVVGLDLSLDMLNIARSRLGERIRRVELRHMAYDKPIQSHAPFDLVVFSYILSMNALHQQEIIEAAKSDLGQGGLMAVVDFNNSDSTFFKSWMRLNHVQLTGQLPRELKSSLKPRRLEVRKAYGGLWTYFIFIGEKSKDPPNSNFLSCDNEVF